MLVSASLGVFSAETSFCSGNNSLDTHMESTKSHGAKTPHTVSTEHRMSCQCTFAPGHYICTHGRQLKVIRTADPTVSL